MEIKTVGVVGAGQMGSGIAQVAAASGFNVIMNDIADAFIQKGLAGITKNMDRMVEKGKLSPQNREEIRARIRGTVQLEELAEALQGHKVSSEYQTNILNFLKTLDLHF